MNEDNRDYFGVKRWIVMVFAVAAILGCNLTSIAGGEENNAPGISPLDTNAEDRVEATYTPDPSPTPEPFFDLLGEPVETEIYHLVAKLRTTSGWTRVLFDGADAAGVDHEVIKGADMPGLEIRRIPELRITHQGGVGEEVEVQYDLYLRRFDDRFLEVGIGKGHLGRTELELILVDGEDQIPLETLVHEGVANPEDRFNRHWFEIDVQEITRIEPLTVTDQRYPKKLFAFYYPWYGHPEGPTGQWRAWDTRPPPNTPVLGLYDSKNEEIFRQHIGYARQAGIDGFLVSWWGFGDFTDQVLQEIILPVAAEEGFPIAIYYEPAESRVLVRQDFERILTTFGRHPAYMRVDDSPVIYIYGRLTRRFDAEDWEYIFQGLEEEGLDCFCQAEGLAAAFHLGDVQYDFLFDLFDGVHMYFQAQIPLDLLENLNRANALKATVMGTTYAATINPGFDNTPWFEEEGFDRLVIERHGGDFYRGTWSAALASDPDWILLTSFNEWHEGTEVEPSEEYGEVYLDLTKKWVEGWKENGSP